MSSRNERAPSVKNFAEDRNSEVTDTDNLDDGICTRQNWLENSVATADDNSKRFCRNIDTDDSVESPDDSNEPTDANSLLREFGHKVIELHCCQNLLCNRCLGNFHDICVLLDEKSDCFTIWEKIGKFSAVIGFIEYIQKVIDSKDVEETSFNKIWPSVLMNLTDSSVEVCNKVLQIKLHETIIKRLKMKAERKSVVNVSELGILYNIIQMEETARELFREQNIVELLRQFIADRGDDDDLYFTSIILMAWVINEDENDAIDNEDVFNYLERELQSSLMNDDHRSSDGYKSVELLAAINKLAVNDANKKRIIESGILQSYGDFLLHSRDNKEQLLAAQGIWTLALNCREEVVKETKCIEALNLVIRNRDAQENVKRQATGALNELLLTTQLGQNKERSSVPVAQKDGRSGEIFISYQHAYKEIVNQVRERLKSNGYRIWIDAEKMSGSLAEDICHGIDTCSLVLAFLSQKYYESPYCRKELIYADTNKKEKSTDCDSALIPLHCVHG